MRDVGWRSLVGCVMDWRGQYDVLVVDDVDDDADAFRVMTIEQSARGCVFILPEIGYTNEEKIKTHSVKGGGLYSYCSIIVCCMRVGVCFLMCVCVLRALLFCSHSHNNNKSRAHAIECNL